MKFSSFYDFNFRNSFSLRSFKSKRAFTLMELIVSITILAILATIAIVAFRSHLGVTRDSERVSDIANIAKSLELISVKAGGLPIPDTSTIVITASGKTIWHQWYVWKGVLSSLNIGWVWKDPIDANYYTYTINKARTGYQVFGLLEEDSSVAIHSDSFVNTTYAAYEGRIPYSRWQSFGIFLGTGSMVNTPIQETGVTSLDIFQTSNPYTVFFSKDFVISWDKSIIGTSSYLSFEHFWNGLSAPSDCPQGFIPVPGNANLNQSGFCVAKYEMSYSGAITPNSWLNSANKDPNAWGYSTVQSWNTVDYIDGKIPVSSAWLYPIVNISQTSAIKACQSMWEGYHLITNSEWMTIARNIEANPDNWSSGIVGNGGIYRGITGETNSGTSLGCTTGDSAGKSGIAGRIYAARSLSIDTTLFGSNKANDCDSKRQLKLSNGQVIWDISGNIWEHVNKANSVNGSGYATTTNKGFVGKTSGDANADAVELNTITTSYFLANILPKNISLMKSNGVGALWFYDGTIFFRGGAAVHGMGAGIFSLVLHSTADTSNMDIGFRCAK